MHPYVYFSILLLDTKHQYLIDIALMIDGNKLSPEMKTCFLEDDMQEAWFKILEPDYHREDYKIVGLSEINNVVVRQ